MRRLLSSGALVLFATASTVSAQTVSATANLPCLTSAEAEVMIISVLPEVIQDTGRICARALSTSALVRQTSGPFIDRYRAEANIAWPKAQLIFTRLAGADATGLLGSGLARPLLAALVTPAITRGIQPSDCPVIERILLVSQPLPPRNAAALFVAAVQLADSKRSQKERWMTLPLCTQGVR